MATAWLRAAMVVLTLAIAGEPSFAPAPAEARAGGSGGYSRPSIRTPSVPGGGFAGGLSRGDLGMSGRGSAEALQRYRSQLDRESWSAAPRTPPVRPETMRPRDWSPPPYAYGGRGNFGALDAMALWFMLDTLSRPSSNTFFRQHQDDPGYRQWREEAERRAEEAPELRAKLDALDRRLAQPAPDFPWVTAVVLVGVVAVLWRARRGLLPAAGRMLRTKAGMAPPSPSPYRIGQTIPFDPAPFVLAGASIKVTPPPDDGSGLVSVAAVGVVTGDGEWHRLHLPDGIHLIQLHLTAGTPDECRLFQRIDQVFPATPEDWAFWLAESDGMIGWPRFETRDGKSYDRVWGGGQMRMRPRALTETATDLAGTQVTRETAMLYGTPTGLAPPAPQTEYVWVAAVEREGQAWIEMRAGIGINPASLG